MQLQPDGFIQPQYATGDNLQNGTESAKAEGHIRVLNSGLSDFKRDSGVARGRDSLRQCQWQAADSRGDLLQYLWCQSCCKFVHDHSASQRKRREFLHSVQRYPQRFQGQ